VLKEEYFCLGLYFDGVFERSSLEFKQAFKVGAEGGTLSEVSRGSVGLRSYFAGILDVVCFWLTILLAHLTNIL
jgi:hypothetical protein